MQLVYKKVLFYMDCALNVFDFRIMTGTPTEYM